MPASRHLGLIVKVTRRCNLRCDYCHDWRAAGHTMSLPVLARLTAQALKDSDRVEFIWHGGEPLLAGRSFFERAMALQDALAGPDQRVRNTLQTNATRLDPAWCRFLADNLFAVGVSLDGPQPIHDRHRVRVSGRGSFAAVERGIRLLREHGVAPGVLVVLTEDIMRLGPRELFRFLVDELEIRSFSLLPVRPDNPGTRTACARHSQYVAPDRYSLFMQDMFDIWYERDDPQISIREIASIVSILMGTRSKVCTLGGGYLGHYYLVDVEGTLQHCDKLLGDPSYTFGNIMETSFAAVRRSRQMAALQRAEGGEHRTLRRRCPQYAVCGGGCPHDRYVARAAAPGTAACCGMRALIEHVADRLQRDLRAVAAAAA